MVSKGGVALRGLTTFLRAVEFLGSILVLGITSYWLGGMYPLLKPVVRLLTVISSFNTSTQPFTDMDEGR